MDKILELLPILVIFGIVGIPVTLAFRMTRSPASIKAARRRLFGIECRE